MKYLIIGIISFYSCLMLYACNKKPDFFTVYTPLDIINVYPAGKYITTESGDTIVFNSYKSMFAYLEEATAEQAGDMFEYQLDVLMDHIDVYQFGRYVDCYDSTNDLNEIIGLDNR